MNEEVYVVFTMDCERIASESPEGGGPPSWKVSRRAIVGWAKALERHGFKGTYFITPAAANVHSSIFAKLEDRGFELGLHLHPGSFRDLTFKWYLGSYAYEEQKEVIELAIEDWERALGWRPETFRAGYTSANDYTFRVLNELKFKQTSTIIPWRNRPSVYAVWIGAYPYPHHVDLSNRLKIGHSDPFEVPITANWRREVGKGIPLDLRVEANCTLDVHLETVAMNLDRMIKLNTDIKAIVCITHNTLDYENPANPKRKVLEALVDGIVKIIKDKEFEPIPATIKEVHKAAHKSAFR